MAGLIYEILAEEGWDRKAGLHVEGDEGALREQNRRKQKSCAACCELFHFVLLYTDTYAIASSVSSRFYSFEHASSASAFSIAPP